MEFPAIARMGGILITGPDARSFLQAQFSADVSALAASRWQWNAWLTPQGRVRALMHLADLGDGTLLAILRGGDTNGICRALGPFRVRQRVTLSCRVFSGHAGAPAPHGALSCDEDAIVLGYGPRSLLLTSTATMPDRGAAADWRREDIAMGWPNLPPGEPEYLPPALGLEHLGAVAFDKGCYPGQEIAARLHYRGGHKHHLYHLRSDACRPATGAQAQVYAPPGRLLDWVAHDNGADALVVGQQEMAPGTGSSGGAWQVVSRFDA